MTVHPKIKTNVSNNQNEKKPFPSGIVLINDNKKDICLLKTIFDEETYVLLLDINNGDVTFNDILKLKDINTNGNCRLDTGN